MSAGLVTQIRQILSASDLPKGALRLEITETLVMENPEKAAAVLEELAAAGVGLSLDDFGTGYSSLTYLNIFPFDTIKVDRALVHGASQTGATSAILRSVVALAHELGKKVVAEGVETEDDASVLRALGCEYAQGFYFDAPMNQRDVLSLLKDLRKEERRLKRGRLLRLKPRGRRDDATDDQDVSESEIPNRAPPVVAAQATTRRVSTVRNRTATGKTATAKPAPATKAKPTTAQAAASATPPPPQPAPVVPLQRVGAGARPPGMPPAAADGAMKAAQASLEALSVEMGRHVPMSSTRPLEPRPGAMPESAIPQPPPIPQEPRNPTVPLTAAPLPPTAFHHTTASQPPPQPASATPHPAPAASRGRSPNSAAAARSNHASRFLNTAA